MEREGELLVQRAAMCLDSLVGDWWKKESDTTEDPASGILIRCDPRPKKKILFGSGFRPTLSIYVRPKLFAVAVAKVACISVKPPCLKCVLVCLRAFIYVCVCFCR